ncbi:hypothetical protein C5167_000584, partial [Papaver somniferum]
GICSVLSKTMNPCRDLTNEFDSCKPSADRDWEISPDKNEWHTDFQAENMYSFEDGIEIFDEETYIEDNGNINLLDRENDDELHDKEIAANNVKELTEEEINLIRPLAFYKQVQSRTF